MALGLTKWHLELTWVQLHGSHLYFYCIISNIIISTGIIHFPFHLSIQDPVSWWPSSILRLCFHAEVQRICSDWGVGPVASADAWWETADGGDSKWTGPHCLFHHNQPLTKWNANSYIFSTDSQGNATLCIYTDDGIEFDEICRKFYKLWVILRWCMMGNVGPNISGTYSYYKSKL